MTARNNGFLQPLPSPGHLADIAAQWEAEGRKLHAIYDRGPRPDTALGRDIPVATLATFEAGLDGGGPQSIPCTLIADVTVRATHQRRGLMRELMQVAMADAESAGTPLMALYAAYPSLYARFGFAPAIRSLAVEVDCARFSLSRRPAGKVHEADVDRAEGLALRVAPSRASWARFGSLSLASDASGRLRRQVEEGTRCIIHTDQGGEVDGVMTYAFQGWTPQAQVLEVLSEHYATAEAHAALWDTVCSTRIASTVRASNISTDDPLPWMLTDRAAWRATGAHDGVSLRVLDPSRALQMRRYVPQDGELVIEVTDETGPASGTWRLRLNGGQPEVAATSDPPNLSLDAKELAGVFLASTSATTLHEAGLITGQDGAVERLDALLRTPRAASSTMHF